MPSDGSTISIDKFSLQARGQIEQCFKVFNHYNTTRMSMIEKLAPSRRFQLVSLLPTLFHHNSSKLPGHVPELGVGAGVHGFSRTAKVKSYCDRFLGKDLGQSQSKKAKIVSLALIGSMGTMAQEERSDFDFWLTVADDATEEEYDLIQQKAELLTRWLEDMDPEIDITIYMGSPSRIRRHHFGAVSDDGAGSALGKMLKEEFYRTCVCWAGKIPFWWLIPVEVKSMDEYQKWLSAFHSCQLPFHDDVMDLGPLERSSEEQFLSAVLWQTNKALKQPFKSILKLSLVNNYAENPEGEFLAEHVKRVVHENPQGDKADPYMMLFETCAQYWRDKERPDAVKIMCEGYYSKTLVGRPAAKAGAAGGEDVIERRRKIIVTELGRTWHFTYDLQKDLDKQDRWDFAKAFAYRDRAESLVKEIFDRTILRLEKLGVKFHHGKVVRTSDSVSEETVSLLSEFSNIGHKVDCFYGASAKKIDPIPPGFQELLAQRSYALLYDETRPRSDRWAIAEDVYVATTNIKRREDLDRPTDEIAESESANKGSTRTALQALEDDDDEVTHKDTGTFDNSLTDFLSADTARKASSQIAPTEILEKSPGREHEIITGKSMLHLAAWLAANRLTKPNTSIKVAVNGKQKPTATIQKIILRLTSFFKHKLYEDKLPEATFFAPPKPEKYYISFDFMSNPQLKIDTSVFERRGDTDRIQQRSKIKALSILVQDSYGVVESYEAPTFRYDPAMLMARLLHDFAHVPTADLFSRIELHSAGSNAHSKYLKEFKEVLQRAHMEFRDNPPKKGEDLRFLTTLEDAYYVIVRRHDGTWDAELLKNDRMLFSYLEVPLDRPMRTIVDPVAEGVERLRAIFSRFVPGLIQVFVITRQNDSTAALQVLDECGSLYNENVDALDASALYSAMTIFVARLNIKHLPRAARKEGRLVFRGWLATETGGGIDGELKYHLEPLPAKPTREAAQGLANLVFVKIQGSLELTEAHRAQLVAHGKTVGVVLPGESVVTTLAEAIAKRIEDANCEDFSIIELANTSEAAVAAQTVEFFALRRGIDRTVRRIIMARTTTNIKERKRETQRTKRQSTGRTRRQSDTNVVKSRDTGKTSRRHTD